MPTPAPTDDAAAHWEHQYASTSRRWSGEPNHTVVNAVSALQPGSALDLGCGEGADALWLSRHGWQVTGVDISATALERAHAGEQGDDAVLTSSAHPVTWVAADLHAWLPQQPPQSWDLVLATYLHSSVKLDRTEVLRQAARLVAPGGHLLIVSHMEPPAGMAQHHHSEPEFLTPQQELDALELDPQRWSPVTVATVPRVHAHHGQMEDAVVLVRRDVTSLQSTQRRPRS